MDPTSLSFDASTIHSLPTYIPFANHHHTENGDVVRVMAESNITEPKYDGLGIDDVAENEHVLVHWRQSGGPDGSSSAAQDSSKTSSSSTLSWSTAHNHSDAPLIDDDISGNDDDGIASSTSYLYMYLCKNMLVLCSYSSNLSGDISNACAFLNCFYGSNYPTSQKHSPYIQKTSGLWKLLCILDVYLYMYMCVCVLVLTRYPLHPDGCKLSVLLTFHINTTPIGRVGNLASKEAFIDSMALRI